MHSLKYGEKELCRFSLDLPTEEPANASELLSCVDPFQQSRLLAEGWKSSAYEVRRTFSGTDARHGQKKNRNELVKLLSSGELHSCRKWRWLLGHMSNCSASGVF